MARFDRVSAMGRGKTPFPTRQMAVLGEWRLTVITTSNQLTKTSALPDMRAYRFHVNLPIRLQDG